MTVIESWVAAGYGRSLRHLVAGLAKSSVVSFTRTVDLVGEIVAPLRTLGESGYGGKFKLEQGEQMSGDSIDDSYLRRLPPEYYRGEAYVHWSLTIEDRKTGWLKPISLYRFRELLTHTLFRYRLCCPIFVLMPDHLHMLWMGLHQTSDQRNAMKHFRTRLNQMLKALESQLQQQGYDNVLKDEERQEAAFEAVCDYIARNPERAGLVPVDRFQEYKYLGSLIPGYPELQPFQDDFWVRFWRANTYLRKNGLHQ